jgi:RHS repeat-associated protein
MRILTSRYIPLTVLLAVPLLFLTTISAHGQGIPNFPTALNDTGSQSGSYEGVRENISVASGNVNLHIPILKLLGRAGFGIDLDLVYDSKFWNLNPHACPYCAYPNIDWSFSWTSQPDGSIAGPWSLSLPTLWSQSGYMGIYYAGVGLPNGVAYDLYCQSGFVLTTSDGAKHAFPNRTNCNVVDGSNGFYPTLDVSESNDGSSIRLDTSNHNDIVAHLKDGTIIHFPALSPNYNATFTLMQDPNGNQITFSNGVLKDTTGRSITLGSGTITYTDSNGASQQILFGGASQSGGYTFQHPVMGDCTNWPGYITDVQQAGGGFAGTGYITLPNGSSGLTYQFTYDSLGEITRIVYPSGGYTRYSYQSENRTIIFGNQNSSCLAENRRIAAKYECRSASGTCSSEDTTTYSNPYTNNVVDVLDASPAHNRTTYTFMPTSSGGLSYETQRLIYGGTGTLLRTVNTSYVACGPSSPSAPTCYLPQSVSTTLNDVSPNLTAATTTTYDTAAIVADMDAANSQMSSPPTCCFTVYIDNPLTVTQTGYDASTLRTTTNTWLKGGNYDGSVLHILDRKLSTIVTDPSTSNWSKTLYEYDNYTQGLASSGAVQHVSVGTARGNVTAVTRWKNQTGSLPPTRYQFDDAGNVLSATDPLGNATTYGYADSWGNTSCVPASGQTAAYRTSTKNALTQIASSTYNSCTGTIATTKDANQQQAIFSYDGLARPTTISYPDGGQTTYCYTDVGGATCTQASPPYAVVVAKKINSSASLTATTILDGLGRVSQTQLNSDPDCSSGDKTDTTYDSLGRVFTASNPYCTTSDPTYGLTTYTYDALGRTTQVTHPDNTTVLTTYTGRAIQVQDEGNGTQRVTRISQTDALGRLLSLCEVASGPFVGAGGSSSSSLIGSSGTPAACGQDIAGTGFLTTYQYDTLSNLLQVNQAGIAPRTFAYDSLSRLLTASNPESGSITYVYDANGNLWTKTSPLPNQTGTATVTATYQYDALNRLTQKSYNDGITPTTTFTYDSPDGGCPSCYPNRIGRLGYATVPGWSFTFGYDPMGRPLRKDLYMSVPSGILYHAHAYDLLGDTTSETAGYGSATYTYNTAARPITVTSSYSDPNNPATVFSAAHYNAFGGLTSDTLGNGETETYSYAPSLTRLQSYTAKLNTNTIYNFNITSFAPNGDILAAGDTANGNWTYGYDPFNRLVGANKNSGQAVYNYVYDRFGNRWQQNGPQTFLATFTGNNQSNPQNNNCMDGYSYDAAGNLLNDGTHSYTYDAENHLIKVDNGSTATYTYDADGNRVQKVSATGGGGDPAGTWQFLYDQSGRMVQRYDGTFWQGNIFVGGRHLVEDGGGTNFSHADWLGTERVRTTNTGAICESIASLPFGDGQTTTGACYQSSPLHFTGKERDSESGLDNFGARYDSSSMGRFMTPDPLLNSGRPWEPQTWNRYAYARNNPLNIVDPTGLYDLVNNCAQDDKKCNKQFQQHANDLKNGLKSLQDQLKNVKDPVQKARLEAALKAIGTEGDHNGVNVNFGATKGGGAGETVPVYNEQTGKVTYNVTFDPGMLKGETGYAIAGAHEGTHVDDISNPLYADPKTSLSDFSLEYRGYQTSAFAASALGGSSFSTNYDGRSYLIWNGSWAAVDKNITNFVTQFHDQNGKPNHPETTPHNPWPN